MNFCIAPFLVPANENLELSLKENGKTALLRRTSLDREVLGYQNTNEKKLPKTSKQGKAAQQPTSKPPVVNLLSQSYNR